jgi:peptide/nickel transport system substrate-binding protein
LSLTAPDARTVVVRFKEPLVYVQSYLAQRGYLNIVPKEAANPQVLDLRQKMLGTGPFMLSDYQPSVALTFKRHAEYWDKERPFIDQIDYPIVGEYATAVAQFRAGNIHQYAVRQEEVLSTKRDVPQLAMYNAEIAIDSMRMFWGFQLPSVRDKRVRQALSMSIARDDWIDAQYNTKTFESEGLKVEKRWSTALAATETSTGWWLDPRGKDFGPNARYYQRDIAEAKKLLVAAGFPDGPEIISNHFTSSQYGSGFPKLVELWEGMAAESGFRFRKNIINYNSDFLPNIRDSQGRFSGVSYKTGPPAPTNDPVDRLAYEFSTKSVVGFHGFDVAGKGDGSGDPYIESQLNKAKVDFDAEKRRAVVHDLQRYLAEAQYCIRWPGGSTSFDLVWPAVRNYRVFLPGTNSANLVAGTTWWLDQGLPPLAKT